MASSAHSKKQKRGKESSISKLLFSEKLIKFQVCDKLCYRPANFHPANAKFEYSGDLITIHLSYVHSQENTVAISFMSIIRI